MEIIALTEEQLNVFSKLKHKALERSKSKARKILDFFYLRRLCSNTKSVDDRECLVIEVFGDMVKEI